jgi:hypothetical protein
MSGFQVSERGTPSEVGEKVADAIRGEHDPEVDPKGWQHGLQMAVAHAISAGIRGVGVLLVNRDLHERTDIYTAEIAAWRASVEVEREKFDALPEAEKREGFVAPKEPDWGPLPTPNPIGVTVSGSVDEGGITTFAVHLALAAD